MRGHSYNEYTEMRTLFFKRRKYLQKQLLRLVTVKFFVGMNFFGLRQNRKNHKSFFRKYFLPVKYAFFPLG